MERIDWHTASKNIIAKAENGLLEQHTWHSERSGRELACLLGAIAPNIGSVKDACAATGMPEWLAELTVALFDGLPSEMIKPMGLRYGTAVNRFGQIGAAGWQRIKTKFLIFTVRQALNSARPKGPIPDYWPQVENACLGVIAALETGVGLGAALAAARSAARSAAQAARAAQFEALLNFIEQECEAQEQT